MSSPAREEQNARSRWRAAATSARTSASSVAQRLDVRGVRGVVDRDPAGPHRRRRRRRRTPPARRTSSGHDRAGRAAVHGHPQPVRPRRRSAPGPPAGSATASMPPRAAQPGSAPGCAARRSGRRPPATARPRRTRRRSRPGSGRPPPRAARRASATARPATTITANSTGWMTSMPSSGAARRARRAARPRTDQSGVRRAAPRRSGDRGRGTPRRCRSSSTAMPAHCEPWPGKTNTGRCLGGRHAARPPPRAGSPSASAGEPGEQLVPVRATTDRAVLEPRRAGPATRPAPASSVSGEPGGVARAAGAACARSASRGLRADTAQTSGRSGGLLRQRAPVRARGVLLRR